MFFLYRFTHLLKASVLFVRNKAEHTPIAQTCAGYGNCVFDVALSCVGYFDPMIYCHSVHCVFHPFLADRLQSRPLQPYKG